MCFVLSQSNAETCSETRKGRNSVCRASGFCDAGYHRLSSETIAGAILSKRTWHNHVALERGATQDLAEIWSGPHLHGWPVAGGARQMPPGFPS